ncbi:MAG: hypothetical protein JXA90_10860, partial [Planctomycetes bacterium]|nr:hypothetical protein [Planctomycetota bacterium]
MKPAARHLLPLALCLLSPARPAAAGEVGFEERFALADDRAKALEELIPGTEEYYYYSALHLQHTGRLEEVDRLLALWVERHQRTARVVEIENRQALLRYDSDRAGALKLLRERLGLSFDHQRRVAGETPDLPSKLDPQHIGREALTRRALERHKGTTDGFEPRALEWAAGLELDADRLRHLLGRLERPDVDGLAALVVADLKNPRSRGFGSHPIHARLLLQQLDECLRRMPELIDNPQFIHVYLTRLWPGADTDWRRQETEREAYLDRIWGFASRLSQAHNSLKAHLLYHRLVHDRARGVYDRARFETYLKLPRSVPYASREHLGRSDASARADLKADFSPVTRLAPVGADEALVRDYLLHFFRGDPSYKPYLAYVDEGHLKRIFAEAKILAGVGDMEEWYSLLTPEQYRALKERVDIDFAFTNKTYYEPAEQVALEVHLKGVETLIVKVFELNALNYYRTAGREVDTAIELDGLVAGEETTHAIGEPDLRRVTRRFEFPRLARRGIYVIELIGGGKSSRALVRKGRLDYRERISTAGHVITVLDEAGRKVPDGSIYLAGHRYAAEEDGTIAVPFTSRPGRQPIVLVQGDFATLEQLDHRAEEYRLDAGIHVEREALLARRKARVMVRPSLSVSGTPATLSVLEDVRLEIATTDREGVRSTVEAKGFEIFEDRESTYEFQVPARLAEVTFTLRARVQSLSQQKKVDLAVGRSFQLNRIDATEKVEALHLLPAAGGYALDLLGKTGEPRAHRPVHLRLKHRDFRDTVDEVLQTDDSGRVVLGGLGGIEWLAARPEGGEEQTWQLDERMQRYPSVLQGRAGEALVLPYLGEAQTARREELSLLELRGGAYVHDRFGALCVRDGALRIEGLAAGDYDLCLKETGARIAVRVAAGEESEGLVSSPARRLEVSRREPLRIASVDVAEKEIAVKVAGATEFTRVHVAATRYAPEYPLFADLDSIAVRDPLWSPVVHPETHYVAGRELGDEYDYILRRHLAKKHAGNMLERPSVILNPWAVRSTETARQDAKAGTAYGGAAPATAPRPSRAAADKAKKDLGAGPGFASLDFLGQPAAVLLNLRPDEQGVVRVAREDLGAHQVVHIAAVDPEWTSCRRVALEEAKMPHEDLRLAAGLDPERRYTEQKKASAVA